MDPLPTPDEILEDMRLLTELMADPHPGLLTWREARFRLMAKLHEKLGKVLDVMSGKETA